MTEHHMASENHPIDTPLADFVDELLGGNKSDSIDMATDTQDLRDLQQTALQLHRAFQDDTEPNAEMSERIRANLVSEWNRLGMSRRSASLATTGSSRSVIQSLMDRLFPVSSSGNRGISMALAGVSLIVLIIVAGAFATLPGSTVAGGAGTTDGNSPLPAFIAIGVVVIGAIVLWFLARDGK